MVGLRAKVLGRLGRSENALTKSVCSILPIARRLRAGVSRTSHPALRFSFALRLPCLRPVLRRIVGGETMTAPGGAGTLSILGTTHIVRAWTTGFSHKVGALTLPGLRPSLRPSLSVCVPPEWVEICAPARRPCVCLTAGSPPLLRSPGFSLRSQPTLCPNPSCGLYNAPIVGRVVHFAERARRTTRPPLSTGPNALSPHAPQKLCTRPQPTEGVHNTLRCGYPLAGVYGLSDRFDASSAPIHPSTQLRNSRK